MKGPCLSLIAECVPYLKPFDHCCAGIVRRKWIWVALFAPLWGVLFVSFGIGPVVTRTSDRLPILYNTVAFLAAALVFRLSPLFQQGAIDTSILKKKPGDQPND